MRISLEGGPTAIPMTSHKEALQRLVLLSEPVHRLRNQLDAFEWDREEALITLTKDHLRTAINRFLDGELSAAELEEWASLVKCRDDIDFEASHADEIAGIIENLTNPSLFGSINAERCWNLLEGL